MKFDYTTQAATAYVFMSQRYAYALNGEEGGNAGLSTASVLLSDLYREEKKSEAAGMLKGLLENDPVLNDLTDRDGTRSVSFEEASVSSNMYWAPSTGSGYHLARTKHGESFYQPIAPDQYSVNLILDPCRGHPASCCQDVFGSPQYIQSFTRSIGTVSALQVQNEAGEVIPFESSRLADQLVHFDPMCRASNDDDDKHTTGIKRTYDGYGTDVYTQCIGENLAMNMKMITPRCWDHNNTINATLPCLNVNGDQFPNCAAIGFISSAAIVACGGKYREDSHCGTFIELHAARSDGRNGASMCDTECNERLLSQVRLEGGFVGGYRTTTIPLTVDGNSSKVVCRGNFELWWVQRTRWGFITQLKKNFTVIDPPCDNDAALDSPKMISIAPNNAKIVDNGRNNYYGKFQPLHRQLI